MHCLPFEQFDDAYRGVNRAAKTKTNFCADLAGVSWEKCCFMTRMYPCPRSSHAWLELAQSGKQSRGTCWFMAWVGRNLF